MSTTLFFLVPIGMLAVVWSFYFVGCVFQTGGVEGPYSNAVLQETSLVAYWPLGDPPNMPLPPSFPALAAGSSSMGAAADLSGKNHVGSFITPPDYPSGVQAVPFSKPIVGPTLSLQQASIVPGDVTKSSIIDKNLFPGSTAFNGGYVSIPWSSPDQLDEFTLEAWILPGWTGANFWWVVFSAFISNTGFRLFINDLNHWEVVIGTGPGNMPSATDTMVGINPASSTPTYVALTCDTKGNLQLWINPQGIQSDIGNMPPTPPPPNWTSSAATGYAAIATTQAVTFFIGAGADELPLRTPTMNLQGAPLYPFQGRIQDVALYNGVLDPATILSHFTNGSGG